MLSAHDLVFFNPWRHTLGSPQRVPNTKDLVTITSGLIGNGMQDSWEPRLRTQPPGAIEFLILKGVIFKYTQAQIHTHSLNGSLI